MLIECKQINTNKNVPARVKQIDTNIIQLINKLV